MSAEKWAKLVLGEPGAAERVAEIEDELRAQAQGSATPNTESDQQVRSSQRDRAIPRSRPERPAR